MRVDNVNSELLRFSVSVQARAALESQGLAPGAMEWIELDSRDDGNDIQNYMAVCSDHSYIINGSTSILSFQTLTGARSVPRVFIGGKFLGGGDETASAAKSGKLAKLLQEAGAV